MRITKARKNSKGFSLIELMVVMFLIAIAAAGVSAVVNPQGSIEKQLNEQGDLLLAHMQYALDDALFGNQGIGLYVGLDESTGVLSRDYYWLKYNGERWEKRGEPLGEFRLEAPFVWDIAVEAQDLEQSLDELLEEEAGPRPVIVFYPNGEMNPFVLDIAIAPEQVSQNPEWVNMRYRITVDERGRLDNYAVGEI